MAGAKKRAPGAGRPVSEARRWMRDIASDEEARKNLLKAVRTDPILYIRVFEAAHGRPPQAVGISFEPEAPLVIVRKATFSDGNPVPTTAEKLPDAGDDQ